MNNKTLSLALIASTLGFACKEPEKASQPSVPAVEVSVSAVNQNPPDIDSLVKSQVAERFDIDKNELEVQKRTYDSKNYPFYKLAFGDYLVARVANDPRSFLFSLGGQYVGQVTKVPGENLLIGQRAGVKSREGYREGKNGRVILFIENDLEDGRVERDLKTNQVYKIVNGKLTGKKPYHGGHGSECQHLLSDMSPGLYFEVQSVILEKSKNGFFVPIEEVGTFFNQKKGSYNSCQTAVSVGVKRRIGQNSFALPSEYEGDANHENLYKKLVPAQLRQK